MITRQYLQICVQPHNGADGPGLAVILRRVLSMVPVTWAAISDVDLVGEPRESLLTPASEVRILPVLKLLSLIEQAEQVVWASVFLCSTKQTAEQITGSEDYAAALSKADALVRVVDASYYYVYGPLERLGSLRRDMNGEAKEAAVEELDFPE